MRDGGFTINSVQAAQDTYTNYLKNFRGLFKTPPPTYLYRPRSEHYDRRNNNNKQVRDYLIRAFENLNKLPYTKHHYNLIDAGNHSCYDPKSGKAPNFGIFSDGIHYTPNVQQWFAQRQWDNVFVHRYFGDVIDQDIKIPK